MEQMDREREGARETDRERAMECIEIYASIHVRQLHLKISKHTNYVAFFFCCSVFVRYNTEIDWFGCARAMCSLAQIYTVLVFYCVCITL